MLILLLWIPVWLLVVSAFEFFVHHHFILGGINIWIFIIAYWALTAIFPG